MTEFNEAREKAIEQEKQRAADLGEEGPDEPDDNNEANEATDTGDKTTEVAKEDVSAIVKEEPVESAPQSESARGEPAEAPSEPEGATPIKQVSYTLCHF